MTSKDSSIVCIRYLREPIHNYHVSYLIYCRFDDLNLSVFVFNNKDSPFNVLLNFQYEQINHVLKRTLKSIGKIHCLNMSFCTRTFLTNFWVINCKSFPFLWKCTKNDYLPYTFWENDLCLTFVKGRQLFKNVSRATSSFNWLHTYSLVRFTSVS